MSLVDSGGGETDVQDELVFSVWADEFGSFLSFPSTSQDIKPDLHQISKANPLTQNQKNYNQ